jgi:hypothetical protein
VRTLRTSGFVFFWSVRSVWGRCHIEAWLSVWVAGMVVVALVALVIIAAGTDVLLWWQLVVVMVRWREERIALRRRTNTVVMPLHESRVQVRGRRLLVLQAVVAFDPFAGWEVVAIIVVANLGHGSIAGGYIRDQSHVRVAGAPGAYFAVCGRACSSSAAGE